MGGGKRIVTADLSIKPTTFADRGETHSQVAGVRNDTVVLWLLWECFARGRPPASFKNNSEFGEWLKAKGIPYELSSYI